jgi:hypothetical protein
MIIIPKTRIKPFPAELEVTKELAELFGNFVAEGSTSQGDIKFSINTQADKKIRENATRFAEKHKLVYRSHIMDHNRENFCITSRTVSRLFKCFKSGAHRKRVPIEIFNILKGNLELCKAFINGLVEGDGYCSEKNGLVYTTVSEKLAYQVKFLFATLGIYSKIYCTQRKENRDSFVVQIQDTASLQKCSIFVEKLQEINLKRKKINTFIEEDNDYFYIPIRKLYTKEYDGTVYNLSVEEDESYIAEGVSVHNCLPALETIAAGIPNIITNYSAHADWGKDALLLCKVAAIEHEPRTGFIKAIADVNDAAKKIHLLASSPKYREEWVKKGLKLARKLDWTNVCDKWENLLDSIDVSDLMLNRYEDPVVADPSIQDFTLTNFPTERVSADVQEQI